MTNILQRNFSLFLFTLNDPDWRLRAKVARHKEHAGKLIKDREWQVRKTALKTLNKTGIYSIIE